MSDDEESSDNSPEKRNLLSTFNVSKLIDLIRERPALWCKTDPRYRNRLLKDKSWREILHHFEPKSDSFSGAKKQELITILMKKWCNVRDSYRKYVTSRLKTNRPYIYADKLTFLKAMVELDSDRPGKKRRYSLIDKTEPQDEEELQEEEVAEEWLNEVYVDMDDGEAVQQKSFRNELSQSLKEPDANDSTVSVLVNLLQREEDEDRSFFKSILPSVKELSPENKFEFRIQVLKILKVLKKRGHMKNFVKSERQISDSE